MKKTPEDKYSQIDEPKDIYSELLETLTDEITREIDMEIIKKCEEMIKDETK